MVVLSKPPHSFSTRLSLSHSHIRYHHQQDHSLEIHFLSIVQSVVQTSPDIHTPIHTYHTPGTSTSPRDEEESPRMHFHAFVQLLIAVMAIPLVSAQRGSRNNGTTTHNWPTSRPHHNRTTTTITRITTYCPKPTCIPCGTTSHCVDRPTTITIDCPCTETPVSFSFSTHGDCP